MAAAGGSIQQEEIYGGLFQTGTMEPLLFLPFLACFFFLSLCLPWAVEG